MKLLRTSLFNWIINPLIKTARYFLDLNNNSILMPVYTPSSANGTLRTSVRFDASDIGQFVEIFADESGGNDGRLFKQADNIIVFAYADSGGSVRFISLPVAAAADVDYTISIGFSGAGVTLSEPLLGSSVRVETIDPSDLNIIRIASNNTGTGNFLDGRQWNTGFTDDTFIQNGEFLQGNGVDLYGQMNLPVDAGDILSFDYVANNTGDAQTLLGMSVLAGPLVHTSTDTLNFGGAAFSEFKVDGRAVTSGSFTFADSQSYRMIGVVNASDTLVTIYSRANLTGFTEGVVGNLLVTKANGDTYQYLLNNIIDNGDGTATAPQTGSVPRFGDELWKGVVAAADWTINGDGTYTLDGSVGGILRPAPEIGPSSNVYRVRFTVSGLVGNGIRLGDSGVFIASSDGDYDVTVPADVSSLGFKRQGGLVQAVLSNISIVETTDALIQNFDSSALVATPQISRFYPMDDGEGTNIRDTLNPSGTTDATVDVGAVTWVRELPQ